ncbi:polysaccharide pyruvyl transferase family protein [Thiobacillus denitrificans]|nr:polysaccharide pyruvyl transferase family protein [Thiobacillus denitrificans]
MRTDTEIGGATMRAMKTGARPVLFGAFDRHNFGDLLFPHLLAALLPDQRFVFRGLAARDLRRFGGHRVRPLASGSPHLVHVGGELLTCSAWQAAVMLRDAGETDALVARYDAHPADAAKWAADQLGTTRTMPYVAGRALLAPKGKLIFNAVGGVEWHALTPGQREEVKNALEAADWLSVRDHVTQDALRRDGVVATLCPDPAVMLRQCFGARLEARARGGAVRAVRAAFPQGYLACQFSGDFADEASLDALAGGLGDAAATSGLGIVLFRAGAAPWHDDLALYEKVRARLPPGRGRLFTSLHVWDICALIAASRGTIASSLHARIAALAFALPRVSLRKPQADSGQPDKVAAFAETWEPEGLPHGVVPAEIGTATARALATPVGVLHDNTEAVCAACRASVAHWAGLLGATRLGQ